MYRPIIILGQFISDRKMIQALAWLAKLSKRDKVKVEECNEAAHGGFVQADHARFHPGLPSSARSKNIGGFYEVYGVNPY